MIAFLNKLRAWLLSPDSELELRLRTLYHKILATRLAFLVQDWLAKRSFCKWRKRHDTVLSQLGEDFKNTPLVSFVLYCPGGLDQASSKTIQSIRNLRGSTWEVILFMAKNARDNGDLSEIQADKQIRVVDGQIKVAIDRVNGEYAIFCEAGDYFYDHMLLQFYQYLNKNPSVDLVYYDCEYYDEICGQLMPHFKPQEVSPELLLSVNYLSRGMIRTEVLLKILPNLANQEDFFAFEYALMLQISEQHSEIMYLPYLLAEQISLVTPDDAAKREVITAHLTQKGLNQVRFEVHHNHSRFTWENRDPSIAIVILTKNHQKYLENLLGSIFTHTKEGTFTITIVDNGSDDQATLAYYDQIAQQQRITIVPYDKPFNYSEAINLGVGSSKSELVLLLNDDMVVRDSYWLEELSQWAIRPEIGVVGAKLLRGNNTIQHAGIIMGLNGFAGHLYLNAPEHYHGLFGSVDWYRNVLAVTGACQMVRREVFEAVGGYDEGYQLAFGDIDFCLRVHQLGFRNMVTPFARFFHYEGQSRGYTTPTSDILKGLEDMKQLLIEGDPYFSPHLTLTRIPKCDLSPSLKASRKKQIDSRTSFYLNHH